MNCGVVPVSAGSAYIDNLAMNEMQCIALSCPCRSGLPAYFCNTKVYLAYTRLDLVDVVARQQSFEDNMKNASSRRLRRGHWGGPRLSLHSRLRCSLASVRRLVLADPFEREGDSRRQVAELNAVANASVAAIRKNAFSLRPWATGSSSRCSHLQCCDILSSETPDKLHHARGVEGRYA